MNDHKSLTSQNGKDTEGVTDQSQGQRPGKSAAFRTSRGNVRHQRSGMVSRDSLQNKIRIRGTLIGFVQGTIG